MAAPNGVGSSLVATYKNRPHMEPDVELRRYISLDALICTLRDRQLRLTRVDRFADPFEGSVPKRQIDDQVPLFSSANATLMTAGASYYPGMKAPRYRDMWTEMTQRRRAMTRSIHASCWIAGPESEGMWRLYCEDGARGQGVAIRSTLAKIEASIERHDLYVSPITYRDYHEGPAFTDDLDPFMHKRLGFAHEHEVRLLKFDRPHYIGLALAIRGGDEYSPAPAAPPELSDYIFLDWSALDHIDAIAISPYADDDYEQRVRSVIASIDPAAVGRIELSVLSERRYAAGF